MGLDKKVWLIGDEVQNQREKLKLVYPISRATVTNWDHMEKVGVALLGSPAGAHGLGTGREVLVAPSSPRVPSSPPLPIPGSRPPASGRRASTRLWFKLLALRGLVMWLQDGNRQAPQSSWYLPPLPVQEGALAA